MSGLGRLQPPDFEHVSKYALADLDTPPTHVPVALGVNWYSGFDSPERDNQGNFWVGRHAMGSIRGGHCFALEPVSDPTRPGKEQDNHVWWPFYNQGQEGSCVGHGESRVMSLLNRKRYDAVWLYNQAQVLGGYVGQEGANVRDGLEVLRTLGHRVAHGPVTTNLKSSDVSDQKEGITAYRWATTVGEVAQVLGLPSGQDYAVILNSWGTAWPERVRIPLTVVERLLHEAGEAAVVTDR